MALVRTNHRFGDVDEFIDLERGDRLHAKRARVSRLAAGTSVVAGFFNPVFIPLPAVLPRRGEFPMTRLKNRREPTFHHFPLLPLELRSKIWKMSHHPRVIEIFFFKKNHPVDYITKNPAVWSVCRESRDETRSIKHTDYQLIIFGNRRFYVNVDIDTFFLCDTPRLWNYRDSLYGQSITPYPWARMQHCILYMRDWQNLQNLDQLALLCPSMKTMTVWVDRQKVVNNRTLKGKTEIAGLSLTKRREPWFSVKHEDRFVEAQTAAEKVQAKKELKAFRSYHRMVQQTYPNWLLGKVDIVFLNPALAPRFPHLKHMVWNVQEWFMRAFGSRVVAVLAALFVLAAVIVVTVILSSTHLIVTAGSD